MPPYETSLILLYLFFGAIILNEKEMYSSHEMLGLFACALICVLGVYIIILKPQVPFIKEKNQNRKHSNVYSNPNDIMNDIEQKQVIIDD